MRRYPGAKGGAGVVQRILSMMPPHRRYIEPFLGSGVVLRAKLPAGSSIAADRDERVIAWHMKSPLPGVSYRTVDAMALLQRMELMREDLVYLDPPYHPETRSRKKLYAFELSNADHAELLTLALSLKASVMLSGYRCPLYDSMLGRWHRTDYTAATRGGPRIESLWCNFTPGLAFHDVRFAGEDFRERWRIKKKARRWSSRIMALPAIERAALMSALETALAAERGRA